MSLLAELMTVGPVGFCEIECFFEDDFIFLSFLLCSSEHACLRRLEPFALLRPVRLVSS